MNIAERRTPEETRTRILEVAWDLFRQLGTRVTIADVAAQLGMSSANVYRFYPSKQALCEAVCANQLGFIVEAAQRIADSAGSPRARLREILLTLYRAMRDQMLNEARVHEVVNEAINERWASIDAYEQEIGGVVARLVFEGQAAGEFGPGDAGKLAQLALCSCCGIHHPVMIALYDNRDGDPQPEDLVEFALRALHNPHPPSGV